MVGEKRILIRSQDGKLFAVGKEVALMSNKVREMMKEDTCGSIDQALKLNVPSPTIVKVIEYCLMPAQHMLENEPSSDDLANWDNTFISCAHFRQKHQYALVADSLEIKSLYELACHTPLMVQYLQANGFRMWLEPTMSKEKNVLLKSKEGDLFEVGKEVALVSDKVQEMMEEDTLARVDQVLEIKHVPSSVIAKVIEYCLKHRPSLSNSATDLESWDKDFANSIDYSTITAYTLAAANMKIMSLSRLLLEWDSSRPKEEKEKLLMEIKSSQLTQETVLPNTCKPIMNGLRYRGHSCKYFVSDGLLI